MTRSEIAALARERLLGVLGNDRIRKIGANVLVSAVAIVIALMTWQYYIMTPWTRNGAIRVQVANVAPQVSGEIIRVGVADNQHVTKGTVLYEIDPFNFDVAVKTAQALVEQTAADYQIKKAESTRRQHLTDDATTPEEQQSYAAAAVEAKAAYDGAVQQLAQAQINLQRTKIKSPVNGYVTNLLMRVGDFANAGQSNLSVVDSDSFWIDGYFEETKISQICLGDPAEAKLMSYSEPLKGHVKTITRGISVANASPGTQGLPDVNPIYTWVRLAQRVPVRIAIETVPPEVPLVSGMTVTVTVNPPHDAEPGWFSGIMSRFESLGQLLNPPPPRAGCLRGTLQGKPVPEELPVPEAGTAPSPKHLDPGLVPGINQSPKEG